MKLHVLVIAAALAFAGSAFAQSGGSSGSSGSSDHAMSADSGHKAAGHAQKKVSKAKKGHAHHTSARMERRGTRAMGAGAASPSTDLGASARNDRMNSAYENWLRLQGRR